MVFYYYFEVNYLLGIRVSDAGRLNWQTTTGSNAEEVAKAFSEPETPTSMALEL
jgi:hypothetical protein